MFKTLLHLVAIAGISGAGLLAAGCSSTSSHTPYGLTGSSGVMTPNERQSWSDDKGHYHPEWREGINTPVGYPR